MARFTRKPARKQTGSTEKVDVYQIVTDQIIAALEAGTVPWQKPWTPGAVPQNAISKKPYRGVNAWLLSLAPYSDPRYVTFKQAQQLGGSVRKGEKGTIVIFWKRNEYVKKNDQGEDETRKSLLLRYYRVWNVEQCEGLKLAPLPKADEFQPLEEAERLYQNMPNRPMVVECGGDRAFYVPLLDTINLPKREQFNSPEAFYATAFHELAHSTGHSSRLERFEANESTPFGCETYGKEELVAEMGSAFLCAQAGIDNRVQDSAAYVASWLRTIKGDPKLVVQAASKAQAAAEYVAGTHASVIDQEEEQGQEAAA